jgi:hypothetical protein
LGAGDRRCRALRLKGAPTPWGATRCRATCRRRSTVGAPHIHGLRRGYQEPAFLRSTSIVHEPRCRTSRTVPMAIIETAVATTTRSRAATALCPMTGPKACSSNASTPSVQRMRLSRTTPPRMRSHGEERGFLGVCIEIGCECSEVPAGTPKAGYRHHCDRVCSGDAMQHFLYLRPLPQGHGSFRPTLGPLRTGGAVGSTSARKAR